MTIYLNDKSLFKRVHSDTDIHIVKLVSFEVDRIVVELLQSVTTQLDRVESIIFHYDFETTSYEQNFEVVKIAAILNSEVVTSLLITFPPPITPLFGIQEQFLFAKLRISLVLLGLKCH